MFPSEYISIDDYLLNSVWGQIWFRIVVIIGMSLLFLLPLNLLKDVTKLRFTAILGITNLIVILLIIIIQSPNFISFYWKNIYDESNPKTYVNWYDVGKAFDANLYFFKGSATFFFSYTCHLGFHPVFEKLKLKDDRRTVKVITRAILLDGTIYLLIGIFGYLTQPFNTPSLIVNRNKIPDTNDVIMIIGRFLLIIMIIFKIPSNYNPLRISIFQILFDTTEITDKR